MSPRAAFLPLWLNPSHFYVLNTAPEGWWNRHPHRLWRTLASRREKRCKSVVTASSAEGGAGDQHPVRRPCTSPWGRWTPRGEDNPYKLDDIRGKSERRCRNR
ncbi:hypothetical protein [Acinetobacter baumannii]|uniref:hypothetical protein n=1 Tax=Acinetobacter baumannii TaxID=470 RepID=UPI0012AAD227|nr:hypothetical protein [Acinetobacter baumannii]